jgi:hypothetical protein
LILYTNQGDFYLSKYNFLKGYILMSANKIGLNEEIIKLIHEEHECLELFFFALHIGDEEKSHYYFQKSVEKKKAYRKLLWGCEEPTVEEMNSILKNKHTD